LSRCLYPRLCERRAPFIRNTRAAQRRVSVFAAMLERLGATVDRHPGHSFIDQRFAAGVLPIGAFAASATLLFRSAGELLAMDGFRSHISAQLFGY